MYTVRDIKSEHLAWTDWGATISKIPVTTAKVLVPYKRAQRTVYLYAHIMGWDLNPKTIVIDPMPYNVESAEEFRLTGHGPVIPFAEGRVGVYKGKSYGVPTEMLQKSVERFARCVIPVLTGMSMHGLNKDVVEQYVKPLLAVEGARSVPDV